MTVYADAQVARACLLAQDAHGVDVNLLLAAAWCADCGVTLDQATVDTLNEHCRDWREQVIKPLRRLRRQWKEQPERAADYEALKRLEISAEREQLLRLEQQLSSVVDAGQEAQAPGSNVERVFSGFGANVSAAQPVVNALVARIKSAGG